MARASAEAAAAPAACSTRAASGIPKERIGIHVAIVVAIVLESSAIIAFKRSVISGIDCCSGLVQWVAVQIRIISIFQG
jgi:hypothetical protein